MLPKKSSPFSQMVHNSQTSDNPATTIQTSLLQGQQVTRQKRLHQELTSLVFETGSSFRIVVIRIHYLKLQLEPGCMI